MINYLEQEALDLAQSIKNDFEKDSFNTCTNILIETLANTLISKRNTNSVADLEKMAKLIETLYNFRSAQLTIPSDTLEAIQYLTDKRASNLITSELFKDLMLGIEQQIQYTELKEGIESVEKSSEIMRGLD
jgi:hypothetical protein